MEATRKFGPRAFSSTLPIVGGYVVMKAEKGFKSIVCIID